MPGSIGTWWCSTRAPPCLLRRTRLKCLNGCQCQARCQDRWHNQHLEEIVRNPRESPLHTEACNPTMIRRSGSKLVLVEPQRPTISTISLAILRQDVTLLRIFFTMVAIARSSTSTGKMTLYSAMFSKTPREKDSTFHSQVPSLRLCLFPFFQCSVAPQEIHTLKIHPWCSKFLASSCVR